MIGQILVIFGILFVFLFWLEMLDDVLTRKFKESAEKPIWILMILLTNIIGSLIYYFIIYKKNKSLKSFWTLYFILSGIILLIILWLSSF